MRKFLVLAIVAAFLMAGAAMASPTGKMFVKPNATFAAGAPATTNNDDSCDIGTAPAATLLLPYFSVDFNAQSTVADNVIFSIVNTSQVPQIAHVTVWSDWSFPVLDFNLYLTGYDVVGVSMWNLISRGVIPATSSDADLGARSVADNPNFTVTAAADCLDLPTQIPAGLLADIQAGLTGGSYGDCGQVGGTHSTAVGYVTVDVANDCTQLLPTDPDYYATNILFDNVLIGDYQRISPNQTTGNYAGGSPLVHIRAIPEGGPSGSGLTTNLPYTFYDRYVAVPGQDRRQPLPGLWAARFIEGGTGSMNTNLAIWREGVTGGGTGCLDVSANEAIAITEIVRFDESENPTTIIPNCRISPCPPAEEFALPETSSNSVADTTVFPPDPGVTGDVGGWMYLNLNNGGSSAYSTARTESQNWVVVQQSSEGRFAVDFDAAWLGNGCSANPGTTDPNGGLPAIGPAGGFCDPDQFVSGCNVTPATLP